MVKLFPIIQNYYSLLLGEKKKKKNRRIHFNNVSREGEGTKKPCPLI